MTAARTMRFRFTPQRREFFDLFTPRVGERRRHRAAAGCELLERFPQDGAELIAQIKELEHTGDRLTHEVVDLLNRTFVTPFDRDDIYRLAGAIDDVCDNVDEAADNLGSCGVAEVPPDARGRRPTSSSAGDPASTRRCSGSRASRTRASQLDRAARARGRGRPPLPRRRRRALPHRAPTR